MPKASRPLVLESGLVGKLDQTNRALLVREVAEMFRVTPGTVYRLCRQNAIPSFRFGGSLRFDPRKLSEWMRRLVSA